MISSSTLLIVLTFVAFLFYTESGFFGVIRTAYAFYIPGISPVGYNEGDVVSVLVNGLHSTKNVIPYDYYYAPFCRPNIISNRHETLGQILAGENQRSSPYYFNMLADVNCRALVCNSILDDRTGPFFEKLIEQDYRVHMVVDNLPVFNNGTLVFQGRCRRNFPQMLYQRGYALGVSKRCTTGAGVDERGREEARRKGYAGKTLINNHLHFRVQYHRVDPGQYFTVADATDGIIAGQTKKASKLKRRRAGGDEDVFLVVGVSVEPFSVRWGNIGEDFTVPGCGAGFNPFSPEVAPLTTEYRGRIAWTYGVTWVEEPNIKWASRWDSYLRTSVADVNTRIHWLSILNSILVVMCVVSLVFVGVIRILRKDIARYNITVLMTTEENKEAGADESGWKAISSDVFRPPQKSFALTILVSVGAQIVAMVLALLVISLFGFLSPAMRGGFMTALLVCFIATSGLAGYAAARMHTKLGFEKSWLLILYAGSFLPVIMLSCFLFTNTLLRCVKSSGSVPFFTLMLLILLWLVVATPLSFLGGSYGYRVLPSPNPQKIGMIPRQINPALEPYLLKNEVLLLYSGIPPLTALFLEMSFILASVWQGVVYYVFGFLTIVIILCLLTSITVSITVVYHKLKFENYNWWWISFFAPNSAGLHMLLFFIYYFYAKLTISSIIATIIYFIYMSLVTVAYVLATGSVGFLCSWAFVTKMYSSIKSE